MYIGNDSYGVCWQFGGAPGWRMVDRDVGSSKSHDDGPLNRIGLDLIAKKFNLPGLRTVSPATMELVSPEALQRMQDTVMTPA